ncbi:MAG: hypothetical protein K2X38_03230 [Gemmataceae bacterium]|nr:hypothetical protein [Gemmataceae bacterium]
MPARQVFTNVDAVLRRDSVLDQPHEFLRPHADGLDCGSFFLEVAKLVDGQRVLYRKRKVFRLDGMGRVRELFAEENDRIDGISQVADRKKDVDQCCMQREGVRKADIHVPLGK